MSNDPVVHVMTKAIIYKSMLHQIFLTEEVLHERFLNLLNGNILLSTLITQLRPCNAIGLNIATQN